MKGKISIINIHGIKLYVLLCMLPMLSFSQLQFVPYDSISVMENGVTLQNAWAGGFNSPQFSQIDLNGDGIKDLFAFERNWNGIIKTFINNGTNNKVDFIYSGIYQQGFPSMHNWTLLADYNCDGKEDIFTSVPAGIAVYRNDSDHSSVLKFTLVSSLLQTLTSSGLSHLYVSPPDLPSLTDVDGDGDLDILSFDVLGSSVSYHKNVSMEKYGNCDKLEFELESECWGYFSESSQDNDITLFDTCSSNSSSSISKSRHAGSALLSIDMQGNGLKDLLLGDISYNNMVLLTNGGSISEASMINADYGFPSNTTPVDLTVFPAAFYLDVNNDGRQDLLISPNNPNTSDNFNNIWHYENIGTELVPVFEYKSNDFLQGQMIDVGEGAKPVFFDANADGLLDIVVGNFGYFIESGNFDSKLALLINTGTSSSPSFEIIDRDYAGLSALNFSGVYPAFGDLDSDGNQDMIIGDNEGNVHLFINTAETGMPAEFLLSKPNYMNIDIGETAMPQIIDVNRDGKPDLLIGERSGRINYFENIGTPEEAFFNSIPTNDFFGDVEILPDLLSGYSSPFLTYDSVGQFLMYVGSENGWLYQYNNIEDNIGGSFNLVDSLFLVGLNVTIAGADLNNNGNIELIFGEYAGGLSILQKGQPQWIGINEIQDRIIDTKLFPNPTSSDVVLQITGLNNLSVLNVEIIDFLGQVILAQKYVYDGNDIVINLDGISTQGIYFVRIKTGSFITTKKLLIN
ncbi:MAG: T9SS type A sorting domain-containing protein [Bacteroidota bacterium]